MKNQSRIKGIMLSYVATLVRTVSRMVLTPLCLKILGIEEYGFYQYVFSVACYATVLDFGISSVVNKFSIEYREKGDTAGVENVMFYSLLFSAVAVLLIIIAGIGIGIGTPVIFGEAVAGREALTRQLLLFMIAELCMLMFQHFFEGVILAAEKYVTFRAVVLVQIILRFTATVILLFCRVGVLSIAIGDFVGVGICLGYEIYYTKVNLKLKVKFHRHDPVLLRNIVKLALALCLQSVVAYLNASIDQYILGRMLGTTAVTIYTIALTFSSFFDEIPTVIQRLYLPQVVKMVVSGSDGEQLTDMVITPGRYQAILVGGILGGFILFGRHFIELWSGKQTIEAWSVALFLMVPSSLHLVQNVCLSILTAMNKRMFRSGVLCGIAVINLLATILLVDKIGLIGAAVATCVSSFLGNIIAMNLYFHYVIKINVIRLFKSILKGILPCAVLASVFCWPLLLVPAKGLIWLLAEIGIFCVVYASLLLIFGINQEEKKQVFAILRRLVPHKT